MLIFIQKIKLIFSLFYWNLFLILLLFKYESSYWPFGVATYHSSINENINLEITRINLFYVNGLTLIILLN